MNESRLAQDNVRQTLMTHIETNMGRPEFSDVHPVHIAVRSLTVDDVKTLVDMGFDVNGLDMRGRTPLLLAAEESKPEMVETLVKRCGADVTIADVRGQTPLHHLPMAETTRILLEAGAAAGAKDCNGDTPLHNAEDAENRGRVFNAYSAYLPEQIDKIQTLIRACHNYVWVGEGKNAPKGTPATRLGLAKAPLDLNDIIYFR